MSLRWENTESITHHRWSNSCNFVYKNAIWCCLLYTKKDNSNLEPSLQCARNKVTWTLHNTLQRKTIDTIIASCWSVITIESFQLSVSRTSWKSIQEKSLFARFRRPIFLLHLAHRDFSFFNGDSSPSPQFFQNPVCIWSCRVRSIFGDNLLDWDFIRQSG